MDRDSVASLAFGVLLGLATNELYLRWRLREFSDAVERGDFDEAQRQLRHAYLTHFPVWLRKPPPDEDADPDED